MADEHPIFPSSDFEDDAVSSSSSYEELYDQPPPPPLSNTVTIAIPTPQPPPTTPPPPHKPPIDDSRRLFQRLWTDEDEIELLQGFLDYTATRGPTSSGHYHDTAAFYDQIKSKLQLDFNKNQLVEKLRRLKKKYRTVLSKINSGKDFVFKSAHDHATFEISRKIWYNISTKFDDDDPTPNPNPNPNAGYGGVTIAAVTPPRPVNSSYVMSQVNLNSVSGGGFDTMLTGFSGNGGGGLPKLCTRKRSRVANAEKVVKTESASVGDMSNSFVSNVGVSSPLQGLVEETIKNCLSPVLKGVIDNAVNIAGPSGGGSVGFKGVGALAMNAVPLNFSGVNVGGNVEAGMDERWRKQQIMELEVYSKRLELVQEQIKLSLEELRLMES